MPDTPCQTRIALLDAAESLFGSRGFDAVGIRDIAREADANLASIKYHFGSKRALYLEAVNRAMTRPGRASEAWQLLEHTPVPSDAAEAAVLLARFIHRFLAELLPTSSDDACIMLIIREGMRPSEALDGVVDRYIRPNQTLLVNLVRVLKPQADDAELARDAQSILGQMMHYRVFRAVIEKLRGARSDSQRVHELFDHVTRFSLRGLGYDDAFAEQAMKDAAKASDIDTAASMEGSST